MRPGGTATVQCSCTLRHRCRCAGPGLHGTNAIKCSVSIIQSLQAAHLQTQITALIAPSAMSYRGADRRDDRRYGGGGGDRYTERRGGQDRNYGGGGGGGGGRGRGRQQQHHGFQQSYVGHKRGREDMAPEDPKRDLIRMLLRLGEPQVRAGGAAQWSAAQRATRYAALRRPRLAAARATCTVAAGRRATSVAGALKHRAQSTAAQQSHGHAPGPPPLPILRPTAHPQPLPTLPTGPPGLERVHHHARGPGFEEGGGSADARGVWLAASRARACVQPRLAAGTRSARLRAAASSAPACRWGTVWLAALTPHHGPRSPRSFAPWHAHPGPLSWRTCSSRPCAARQSRPQSWPSSQVRQPPEKKAGARCFSAAARRGFASLGAATTVPHAKHAARRGAPSSPQLGPGLIHCATSALADATPQASCGCLSASGSTR